MKKILALAIALVMSMSVLCVGVSALNTENKTLLPQLWLQDTATWSWKEAYEAGSTAAPKVEFGETKEVVYADFSNYAGMDTSADFNFGLQVLDETLTEDGDSSTIGFYISDITFKANGYDDIVVAVAGDYTVDTKGVMESWGSLSGNGAYFNDQIQAAVRGAVGTGADVYAYFSALTSVSFTITYTRYNDETADVATPAEPADATPAEPDPVEDTPAETAPVETAPTKSPATGLAVAVVPAIVAMAAVAVSKKR